MSKWLSASALHLAGLLTCAWATVYELPASGSPVLGTDIRVAGTYEIHGTNNPVAVGLSVTHGCIRMYSQDVAALFALVPIGTKVWLINEPIKVAYVDGKLLMEVHPPVDNEGQTVKPNPQVMSQKLRRALGGDAAAIHWEFAREALEAATGVPTVVGLQAHFDPVSAPTAPPGAQRKAQPGLRREPAAQFSP